MHLALIAALALLGLASAAPYSSSSPPVQLPQDVPSSTTLQPSTEAYEVEMPSSSTPVADVPSTTTTQQAYGNYGEEMSTSTQAADVPSTTTLATTTEQEEAYGSYSSSSSSTTPAADVPTTSTSTTTMEPVPSTSDSYGNYGEEITSSTTPASDVPTSTSTTTMEPLPSTSDSYGYSSSSSTPAADVSTTSTSTTTMEPMPSTSDSYGYSSSSSTPADLPSTTEQQNYGSYGEEISTSTLPAVDEPSSTQTSSSAYGNAYGEQSIRSMDDASVTESSGQFPWNDGGDACNGRADGLYELSACSAQFLTCSGGIARIMDCPFGLIYNTPIEACDYPHEVASCNEASGAAADLPESTTITTEMPQTTQRIITDCEEGAAVGIDSATCISDGLTSLSPCSSHFEMCLSGKLFTLSCGADSVFLSAGRCVARSDSEALAECNPQELDSVTSSTPSSTSPAPLPSTTHMTTSY